MVVAALTAATSAENWANWASALEGAVTAIAVVVGAVWAYFRFFKDRIYRPRIEMVLDGGFIEDHAGQRQLLCSLTLRNIGGTKVRLVKVGSGLKVTQPRVPTSKRPISSRKWDTEHEVVFGMFEDHDWIESHETIRDEVLLAPFASPSDVYRLEARIKVARRLRSDIAISTVRILGEERAWNYSNSTDKGGQE
jgi:hypothetical protein